MNMEQPIISISNLSHRYSQQWAVRDINLEIHARGIYGLLGSNGAGKSTLMNIMCGVLKQTQGNVLIHGVNTREHAVASKRFIGFLPQKPPLYGDLTVEEYLRYAAYLRWIPDPKIEAAIDEVLDKCNITHFRNRLINNLSGGYQQRVGIAQAIIHKPVLVVLDEPTNGLDPNQILEIRKLIKDIAADRTVVLSTHILTEVQAICQAIYMVEQGKIVFSGSVENFDNYITPTSLLVTLMNPPTENELAAIPGVTGVELISRNHFRIRFSDSHYVVQQVVKKSVEENWELEEIFVEKASLDSIFSELSKK